MQLHGGGLHLRMKEACSASVVTEIFEDFVPVLWLFLHLGYVLFLGGKKMNPCI